MPVTVEKTINVRQLQVGDVILRDNENEPELTVTARPLVKVKYAYVGYRAKDIVGQIPFDKDESVLIRREEPTEEEAAESQRKAVITWVAESLARARERLVTTREKLINNLDMRDASWHGRHWASYATAQIELGLWNYVAQVAQEREIDYYDALLIVRDEVRRRLFDYGHFLPRSSDMMTNYAEALESDTRLSFLQIIEYHV